MSVEIVLIPLALAAVSAWKASRKEPLPDGQQAIQVGSRMRDETLLARALADTGAATDRTPHTLTASWSDVRAEFCRDEQGIWSARMTGSVDEARAIEIITAVDQAYGRQVQQTLLATLRVRASAAGMTIEDEHVDADQTVTLTLAVQAGANA
jgi:hypothetical protein